MSNPQTLTTSQALATVEQAIGIISQTLSHTSQRVYQCTYDAWLAFCEQHNLNPLAVTLETLSAFIHGGTLAKPRARAAYPICGNLPNSWHCQVMKL